MNFEEAILHLKEGKRIRRSKWSTGTYITIPSAYHKSKCITIYYPAPEFEDAPFSASAEDILKDDWEIYPNKIYLENDKIKDSINSINLAFSVARNHLQKIQNIINDQKK